MRTLICILACAGALAAQQTVTGFVDTSLRYDMDPEALGFAVDQLELDVERVQAENLLLRGDLDFVDDGAGGWSAAVEQAYIRLGLGLPLEATLVAGRFNAPIGFESLDAPDMFQYSHALVFDYGLPVNFTGARLDLALPAELDLKLILANGWDNNTDADMEKTFAGRLGRPFGDFGIGFSWIADAEVNGDDSQLVLDVDATWVHDTWRVGVEYNMGTTTVADQDLGWSGLLLMCHKDFSDRLGLTLRYDSFDDSDNLRLGETQGVVRTGITIAPTFVLGEKLGAVIEYRMDTVDEKIWVDGDGAPTDASSVLAFELTCGF
jgi:hypothetical protein